LILLSFLFSLSSCASSPPAKKEDVSPETKMKEIESSMKIRAMNEKILMGTLSSRRATYRDYKVGSDDLLEIGVFEDEKLNKTVRVSSQGNISLPLLGVIRVKGLTTGELEREIRDLLAEKYLQDPHVSVFIKEFRSQRISIIGAVEKPGVFEVSGEKTVLDMIGMAGGLKQDAGTVLFLIRPPQGAMEENPAKEKKEPEDQTIRTFMIDLEELLVKGELALNLPLINGDVINIPVSGKVFVGGEVKTPGGFALGKRMTVGQAVTMAGGLNPKAEGAEAKIFRFSGKEGGKDILSVNLYEVAKGNVNDIYLRENDIVMVPKSGVKSFLIEFRDTVKGLLGFGFSLGSL
jgi:polysaccharide biosynthesis/export protein